jgi:hypothetical protein
MRPRRRVAARGLARAIVLGIAALSFAACSALITHDTQQCTADGDCAAFHAVCDKANHVCVAPPSTSSSGSGSGSGLGGAGGMSTSSGSGAGGSGGSGGSCTGDAGCYACQPKTTDEFLNACTDATCKHFDNSRCTMLSPDGGLPTLP